MGRQSASLDLTFALRAYARRRIAQITREDVLASQRRQLQTLVHRAQKTRFGRNHDFAAIRSVADYQRAVPLRRYDDFWRDYWSAVFPVLENVSWPGIIPCFANSSGTSSGVTKHIPVSAAMMNSNRRAAIDLLVHHAVNRPHSRILGGKNFFLGGSAALNPIAPDVAEGDLSGITAARVPWWARHFYFPTGPLAALSDWESKTRTLAERSLAEDIRSLSGTPSWLLLFVDELKKHRPEGRFRDFYPDLELLVHGGVSFRPYRARFTELLEGSHAETREVYPASEGFIALQDRGPGEGLRLLTDNGLFFEFVPVDALHDPSPPRHWLGDVEAGVNYAVVLTSNAGLWSYVLGDTVRFIETKPPRLLITGRTSYGLSAFGEHLTGEEIDRAVALAAAEIGAGVADYTMGPVFIGRGHHLYVVELDRRAADAENFAATIDRALSQANADYAEHRRDGYGMAPPQVVLVPPGSFAVWMKSRGKLGGQNKVPRVIADPDAFRLAAAAIGAGSA